MRLFLILMLSILPLSSLAQDAATQPEGTIAVQSDGQQDAAIANRIREIIGQLGRYEDVSVIVADGIVTLRGTTLDTAQIEALNALVARVEGVVAIENRVTESTDVVERLNPAVERIRNRTAQAIAMAPLVLVAAGAGVGLFVLGLLIARRRNPWDRIAPNAFIADIYRQVIRLFFAVAGVVLALDLLNATALLGTILGAAGIVGLAIGFAVRDTVENFIASIMLSIRQPFRPKDLVEIQGDIGHVIRLTSRATILLSLDGNHIRIPNSTVFNSRIVNFTRNDERRFTFLMGIDPNADIAEAQRIMMSALEELPFVLQTPAPSVWVEGLGASTIDISGAGWIMQHETSIAMAKGEAIRIVKSRLEEAGITLPEPTYRLITAAAGQPLIGDVRTPAGTLPTATTPAEVRDVDAGEAKALADIVDAERETAGDEDLLRREAPQE